MAKKQMEKAFCSPVGLTVAEYIESQREAVRSRLAPEKYAETIRIARERSASHNKDTAQAGARKGQVGAQPR